MIGSSRGAVLVVSLWILAILSVLALGMSYRLSLERRLSHYVWQELRTNYLAKAGVAWAASLISQDDNEYDSLYACGISLKENQKAADLLRNISVGDDGFFDLQISDEAGKINLNTTTEDRLTFLIKKGSKSKDIFPARKIARAIMDWRDEDHVSPEQQGAEDEYYESLAHPYSCADRPFRSLEELLLVRGITPEIFQKIYPSITVFGDPSDTKINLNTASQDVIAVSFESLGVLEDTSIDLAKQIVAYRSGDDGKPGTEDDRVFREADIASLELIFPEFSARVSAPLIPVFKNDFKSYSSYYRIDSVGKLSHDDGRSAQPVQKKWTAIVRKEKGLPLFLYVHQD